MKRYGLIGFPLGHSFSAGYFADKFAALGAQDEYVYENFPMEHVGQLRTALPADLLGFNVTIPHKRNILPLLSEIDPEARAVGAVNCVKVLPDKGYNTDIYGFEASLRKMLAARQEPFASLKALVLGTGGAAQAVHHVLRKLGIGYVEVSRTACGPQRIGYEQLTPEMMAALLPYDSIGTGHYLYDLIYNPAETAFLHEGRIRGAWVKSGLEMLVLQAERSWEIWNEQENGNTSVPRI